MSSEEERKLAENIWEEFKPKPQINPIMEIPHNNFSDREKLEYNNVQKRNSTYPYITRGETQTASGAMLFYQTFIRGKFSDGKYYFYDVSCRYNLSFNPTREEYEKAESEFRMFVYAMIVDSHNIVPNKNCILDIRSQESEAERILKMIK